MNYSDKQLRDALTTAAAHDGVSVNGNLGEEQWYPREVDSVRRILDALDSTPAQPLSDTIIDFAYSTATGWIPSPETTHKMREFIKIINQTAPRADEWEQCEFDDIREGDRVKTVRTIRDGTVHTTEGVALRLYGPSWASAEGHLIARSADFDMANIAHHRIPAKVTHPDPELHPFIFVTGYEDHTDDGVLLDEPVPYFWNNEWYEAHHRPALTPTTITDWVPAEMVAKNV